MSAAVISLLKRLIFLPWQISEDTDNFVLRGADLCVIKPEE
nr:MAG TPA: hypothetical protein [Caudoviricetes sp.]